MENEKLDYVCGVCKLKFFTNITPSKIKQTFLSEHGYPIKKWICPTCKESNPNIKTVN